MFESWQLGCAALGYLNLDFLVFKMGRLHDKKDMKSLRKQQGAEGLLVGCNLTHISVPSL